MAALVAVAIAKLWPSFLLNPARALPAFKAAVVREVRSGAQASGALAQRQYRRQRTAAGETSTYRTSLATLPAVEDIAAMVEEALAGVSLDDPEAETVADAKARLAKAAEDVVFDTGVRTILENAGRDRAARGIARIPEPGACAAGSAACWPPVAPSTRTAASRAATPSSPMERSPPRSRSTTTAGATPSPCSASTRRLRGSARQRPPTSPPARPAVAARPSRCASGRWSRAATSPPETSSS
jgi:hypothetical protein